MWIKRDFQGFIANIQSLPVKILKGPRQVGKTSFLESLGTHSIIYLDDATARLQAQDNPRFFLDNLPNKLILDEGALAPQLFPEIKRRVDESRRNKNVVVDYWITGSNQTLLDKNIRESLAGRASYYDFNGLSIHELNDLWSFSEFLIRGGWPELYVSKNLDPVRYLNDLIVTFIEKDIVNAAGIERKEAFIKVLKLTAARVGQIFNFSDVASVAGIEATTVKSWLALLQNNGVLRSVSGYFTNLNKRLIKSPKLYLEDVALAVRLQGWSTIEPLLVSPIIGHLFENMVLNEVTRFFINRGILPDINFLRSKEKVEVDFIVNLPNQKALAIEVKMTPQDFTKEQRALLDSSALNIIDTWVVSPVEALKFKYSKVVTPKQIYSELSNLLY